MKLLYPTIEIAFVVSFVFVLVYVPTALWKAVKLTSIREGRSLKIAQHLWGTFVGLVVGVGIAAVCVAIIGASPETIFINFVQDAAAAIRWLFGYDPIEICIADLQSKYRWTPDTFASEASHFNILEHNTLTERQTVLAEGQKKLLFERGYEGRTELYDLALRDYCKKDL